MLGPHRSLTQQKARIVKGSVCGSEQRAHTVTCVHDVHGQQPTMQCLLSHFDFNGRAARHINKPCGHARVNQCTFPYTSSAACRGALFCINN